MRGPLADFAAPLAALAALTALTVAFALGIRSFREAVTAWAERDLAVRTELAASTLAEPLALGDFARVHEFGARSEADGVRLVVRRGGEKVFDTLRKGAVEPPSVYASHAAGAAVVTLGLPLKRVLAPFERARVLFVLAALVGAAGVLVLFVSTYRQRVRLKELSRLERFRREFIADFSHELKTPLAGILGAMDLFEPKDAVQSRLVPLVRQSARRLNALSESILDLSRLERTDVRLERTPTDLAELARETVEAFRPQAERAGVALHLRPGAPVTAACDPELVARALGNLVANALCHSRSPEVTVSFAAEGRHARLAVEDRGVGIPKADSERIFERFRRLEASRTEPGTGLGLAIVRQIARLHGGDVTVEEVRPRGARFVMTIGNGQ